MTRYEEQRERPPERTSYIGSVNVLLTDKNGRSLYLRRAGVGWASGQFNLPAGHPEITSDGLPESLREAAARELEEETGIRVKPDSLTHVHTMVRSGVDDDYPRVDFFFQINEWEGEPTIAEPEKADELAWFNPDELPENTLEHVRLAIAAIAIGTSLSEVGFNGQS